MSFAEISGAFVPSSTFFAFADSLAVGRHVISGHVRTARDTAGSIKGKCYSLDRGRNQRSRSCATGDVLLDGLSGHVGLHQLEVASRRTDLVAVEENDLRGEVSLPIQFQDGIDLNGTNLFSRMVGGWSDVPLAVLQHLRFRQNTYGFIGMHDYTLYPLLRPGSFVQIDPRLRRIQPSRWRTEFDRPIYFLELRDG